ncbi:MAG: cyclic nucleotide-binding domain-containing protein [Deltaproteobacteria bacterium]|nr:cyclic nucleotide-binding domain-containing protein [Deltaproteobacteria bacterium]MBW1951741.1 cyclic nucleotide-binding domain-containing protein [Deltaproteobacteria bacterium]MBW2134987.1 cyclic nucleotide-binding domain-containing protein [Deltaproteobacteria bacterium]
MANEEKEIRDRGEAQSSHSADLSSPLHLKISQIGKEKTVPAHTLIVKQGEIPEHFYVIRQGQVQVFRETRDHIRTELAVLGPGAYFGELALVTNQPRTASVETLEETRLIEITRAEFDQLLDDNPQLARVIIRQLTQWLVEGDKRLETQVVRQVRVREISWFDYMLLLGLSVILAIIFNFSNPNGIPLVPHFWAQEPVPRVDLAQAYNDYSHQQALFIDARPTNFYDQKHIKGAVNLPLPLFDFIYTMRLSQVDKDKPLIVYGRNISRHYDDDVARKLILRGHTNVKVLDAGVTAWEKTNYPTEP